jgi:hypothetical protein
MDRHWIVLGAAVVLAATSTAARETAHDRHRQDRASPFPTAEIRLEYSATDEDAEVVMTINAGAGLTELEVLGPDRRRVVHLTARDGENLGLAQIVIETPEPSLAEVIDAFPAGTYRFRARTIDGLRLASNVVLSHALPAVPVIVSPSDGATEVPLAALAVAWAPVDGAIRYGVEVEHEGLALVLKSDVLPESHSFALPANWAQPETEYVLGVMAVNAEGNRTVSELRFRTGH